MDIVFLVVTIALALLVPRNRAMVGTVAAWAVCLAAVGWGPAHNSSVHLDSVGFWGPWAIVLLLGLGIVAGIDLAKRRRTRGAA